MIEKRANLLSFIRSLYSFIFMFRDEVPKTRAVAEKFMVTMVPTSSDVERWCEATEVNEDMQMERCMECWSLRLERCRRATFDGGYLRVWNALIDMREIMCGGGSHCKMF